MRKKRNEITKRNMQKCKYGKKKRNEKNFSTVWVVVYMVAGGYRDWTVCVGRSRALCSPALVMRAKHWTTVWAARQQQRAANLNVNWSGRRPPLPRAGDVVLVVATAAPAAAYPSSSWKRTCCYFFFSILLLSLFFLFFFFFLNSRLLVLYSQVLFVCLIQYSDRTRHSAQLNSPWAPMREGRFFFFFGAARSWPPSSSWMMMVLLLLALRYTKSVLKRERAYI